MTSFTIRHTATFFLSLPALLLMSVLQSCGCGCGCHCCDEPDIPTGIWYKTYVEADYDREWFIPVTPRYD